MTGQTGDLDIARILTANDDFIEGHKGLDADEHFGDKAPSEPGTITLHLNGEVVDALLAARGWKRGDARVRGGKLARDGAIYAPDGDPDGYGPYWDRAEALTLALTAEAC